MIGALVCLLLQSQQPLFTIARSTNANLVQYDARVLSSGAPDPKQPVVAYWIMLAQDGRHAELTGTEKRMAYGFTLMPDAGYPGLLSDDLGSGQKSSAARLR